MSICAARLTPEGFARFGTVVVADGAGRGRSVNQGWARRIPGIDNLSHDPAAGKPVLDIYSIEPSQLPFTVSCLERHPLSSQVFMPVACARFLVVVAASDAAGQPDLTQVLAFIGDGTQIVHYRKGVWHAPMVALDTPAVMTMLMWESGGARDCEEFSGIAHAGLRIVE